MLLLALLPPPLSLSLTLSFLVYYKFVVMSVVGMMTWRGIIGVILTTTWQCYGDRDIKSMKNILKFSWLDDIAH